MRVGLGQFNAVVGDLQTNTGRMLALYQEALARDVDLLVFPELAVCGYPPEDLLLKKHFLEDNRKEVEGLATRFTGVTVIVGFADLCGDDAFNSAAVLRDGKISDVYRKGLLPNYSVFDEKRYFEEANTPVVIDLKGLRIAVSICADMWDIEWLGNFWKDAGKIDFIVNISASPFYLGKIRIREEVVGSCAKRFKAAMCYCNLVGGQDELVFDGRSMFCSSDGRITAMAAAFQEDLLIADVAVEGGGANPRPLNPPAAQPGDVEEIYRALVLGTRDYMQKNGFRKVLIGLSGGIDSSVTAEIAVAALDGENVIGVTMPSHFSSRDTISDAERLARNLGIEFLTIPIKPVLDQFDAALGRAPGWNSKGIAYENLQARIRGMILMSLSNQSGAIVLTTGNKSETAVGYTTLYGDTAGGFAVIKDVFKTMVYKLAEYINSKSGREVIPVSVMTRPPTAELRPNQKDSDSLPPYDLLDEILKGYVEQDKSARQLIEAGLPKGEVRRVIRMVDQNEYKRRLSPPGVKITPKAFGRDRRMPITNRYGQTNGEA